MARPTIKSFLTDRFASEWKLLAETEAFISNTPDFPQYEALFKDWRARLRRGTGVDEDLVSIRSEIVALRRELRLRGYDLSLGLQRLIVDGFRNDDSLAQGFRRVVLCFCGPEIFWKTGSGNHVTLADELLSSLAARRLLHDPEVHYLWFLRSAQGLILSGSATEPADCFRRLEARARANPLKLLSSLRELA